ncbi:MAG: hypothetical protein E6Q97_36620 [Desulfurellales bacterium]|nr:MAG: hypothetical protein E6Q97_36620 [Desulfurellales bacterium]
MKLVDNGCGCLALVEADKIDEPYARQDAKDEAIRKQKRWNCPSLCGKPPTVPPSDPDCHYILESFAGVVGDDSVKQMCTCPRYYQTLPGIQDTDERGLISIYNACDGSLAGLPSVYGESIPYIITDAFITLKNAIAAKDAHEDKLREKERNKK